MLGDNDTNSPLDCTMILINKVRMIQFFKDILPILYFLNLSNNNKANLYSMQEI